MIQEFTVEAFMLGRINARKYLTGEFMYTIEKLELGWIYDRKILDTLIFSHLVSVSAEIVKV